MTSNTKEKIKDLIILLLCIIISFSAGLFIKKNWFEVVQVNGLSMLPTLEDGDRYYLDKHNKEYNYGDIIAIKMLDDRNLVKRVIAKPGDTIELQENKVIINGKVLEEDYILEDTIIYNNMKLTLDKNYYFVMGDNRRNSLDSREIGPVTVEQILGKIKN